MEDRVPSTHRNYHLTYSPVEYLSPRSSEIQCGLSSSSTYSSSMPPGISHLLSQLLNFSVRAISKAMHTALLCLIEITKRGSKKCRHVEQTFLYTLGCALVLFLNCFVKVNMESISGHVKN
ncbi:hypothetical protein PGB90_005825 [Kerria lacca]